MTEPMLKYVENIFMLMNYAQSTSIFAQSSTLKKPNNMKSENPVFFINASPVAIKFICCVYPKQ